MHLSDPIRPDAGDALPDDLPGFRALLEARIDHHVTGGPARLMAAARGAVLSPGKRMRPYILHLVARTAPEPVSSRAVLDAGVALEMVHAASLVLDDLPCMDGAALRRGRPTCHVLHGEATAILAAVGLLNGAFAVLAASPGIGRAVQLQMISTLAGAVGWQGLVAGQEHDLNGFAESDGAGLSPQERSAEVNRLKTGQLLVAATQMGAALAAMPADRTERLSRFATDLGQAFQIADDLADALRPAAETGKDAGQDAGKATLLAELGPEIARQRCQELLGRADQELVASGVDPVPFRRLIACIFDRDLLAARTDPPRAAWG